MDTHVAEAGECFIRCLVRVLTLKHVPDHMNWTLENIPCLSSESIFLVKCSLVTAAFTSFHATEAALSLT